VKAVMDLNLEQDVQDEKLLILKKRYTGHMRFVGEIYMKDMLKAHVMHHCVTELLDSVDENGKPDNEKLACLCKLFQTIGKKLEEYELKKKRTKVQEYFDRIAVMATDKSLSSKIRFGFKDLIEMRLNNWTARRVEEKAKKLSEIRKDDRSNQSTPRSSANTPRNAGGSSFGNGSGSGGGKSSFQDARQSSSGTGGGSQDARSRDAPPADEWTTVTTSTKGKRGKNLSSSSSSSSSSTPTGSGNTNINKFSALNVNTKTTGSSRGGGGGSKNSPMTTASGNIKKTVPAKTTKDLKIDTKSSSSSSSSSSSPQTDSSAALLPGHDGEVDAITVKRIIAAFNEYYGNDLIDELVEVLNELVHEQGMWQAVHSTMYSVMGLSTPSREKFIALLPKLYERKVLTREQTVKGISSFLHIFDDFVVDVPLLAGHFSTILATLFVNDVFEGDVRFITTLPEENDFTMSMKMMSVIVQTAMIVKSLSTEEKAMEFYKSALDVEKIDEMQKELLTEAIEKFDAQFLQA
jgi:translation initiation factor 4G